MCILCFRCSLVSDVYIWRDYSCFRKIQIVWNVLFNSETVGKAGFIRKLYSTRLRRSRMALLAIS